MKLSLQRGTKKYQGISESGKMQLWLWLTGIVATIYQNMPLLLNQQS